MHRTALNVAKEIVGMLVVLSMLFGIAVTIGALAYFGWWIVWGAWT